MEKEISSGAMLGIVLIALAAIIGLGFGIFAIAKGVANEGTVNVQDQLGQVSLATFNDYDQKIVTGTQVLSAYSNFAGKPYAILIATQSYIDGNTNGLSEAPAVVTLSGTPSTPGSEVQTTNSDGEDTDLVYLNYNALLGPDDDATLYFDNGLLIQPTTFSMTNGKINFNTVTGNLSKSGQVEYVPTGGRFQANLVKDASGTIMGIAFQQVATK